MGNLRRGAIVGSLGGAAITFAVVSCGTGDVPDRFATRPGGDGSSSDDAGQGVEGGEADAADARSASDAGVGDGSWDGGPPITCNMVDGGAGLSGVTPVTSGGTRIRPQYLVLDDGTRVLYSLFDLQANTTCTLRPTGGSLRCLPYGTRSVGGEYFTDALCTQAIHAVYVSADCSPPTHADWFGYREIGAALTPQTLYAVDGAGACTAVTPPPNSELRSLGALQPEASFVAFHQERQVMLPGLIDAIMQVGDDGTRLWLGDVFDTEHDVPANVSFGHVLPSARAYSASPRDCCSPSLPAPCVLTRGGEGSYTCSPHSSPLMSRGALLVTDPHGPGGFEVYPIGAPLPGVYCGDDLASDGGCTSAFVPTPDTWTLRPAMPHDCFLAITGGPVGTGRLSIFQRSGGGMSFPVVASKSPIDSWPNSTPLSAWIVDTQAPVGPPGLDFNRCHPVRLEDGMLHCAAGIQNYWLPVIPYADAACTQPVWPVSWDYPYAAAEEEIQACAFDAARHLFTGGSPIDPGTPVPTYRKTYDAYGFPTGCTFSSNQRLREAIPVDPASVPLLPLVRD